MTQTTFLPKIGAPLRAMTAAQIESERALFAATCYNIAHRAKIIGVHRSTLAWHLRGSNSRRPPRITPRIQKLIDAGDALLALAPKTVDSRPHRLAWTRIRDAIIRRKKDI